MTKSAATLKTKDRRVLYIVLTVAVIVVVGVVAYFTLVKKSPVSVSNSIETQSTFEILYKQYVSSRNEGNVAVFNSLISKRILTSQKEALEQRGMASLTSEELKKSTEKSNDIEIPLINFEYLPKQSARLLYQGYVPATEKIVAFNVTRTVFFVYEDGAWKIDSVKTDYTN